MHERKAIMSRESCAFVGELTATEMELFGTTSDLTSLQVFLEASERSRSAPR